MAERNWGNAILQPKKPEILILISIYLFLFFIQVRQTLTERKVTYNTWFTEKYAMKASDIY